MKGILIIAPLMIVIVLGVFLKSKNFLNDDDRGRFTKLLYWIVLPCLLFRSIYIAGGDVGLHKNLFLAIYSSFFIVPLIALVVGFFIHKDDRRKLALSVMASIRSNNVYLGMPAVVLAMGNQGAATASIFLAISLPGYNLISVFWGELVASGGISIKPLIVMTGKLVKNPLIASSLAALICAQSGVHVPKTLLESMKLVGDMATGLALLSLGMSLELKAIRSALKRVWADVLLKLVIYPTAVWLLLQLWPVSEIMTQTAVLISAMPTAVNTFILAKEMNMDDVYACEIVAVTTTLAAVTVPVWAFLLGIA